MTLPEGAFIETRSNHPDRPGHDGFVVKDFGDDGVALTFWWDRYCQPVPGVCVGPEMWERDELDFETIET